MIITALELDKQTFFCLSMMDVTPTARYKRKLSS